MEQQQLTKAQAEVIVDKVRRKIDKYVEARRIAETAFDKLQARPDWPQIAKLLELYESSNFGDWTC